MHTHKTMDKLITIWNSISPHNTLTYSVQGVDWILDLCMSDVKKNNINKWLIGNTSLQHFQYLYIFSQWNVNDKIEKKLDADERQIQVFAHQQDVCLMELFTCLTVFWCLHTSFQNETV